MKLIRQQKEIMKKPSDLILENNEASVAEVGVEKKRSRETNRSEAAMK
jgi:hypothetical protein